MADNLVTNSLADGLLLKKIDTLFYYKLGEYVSLPSLIIVGDQSSGKSSVLEGLTDLPFPRDSGPCTRFVTHITSKRSAETKVSVSILPTANARPDYAEKVRDYHPVFETLTKPIFTNLVRSVHKLMGLKDTGTSDSWANTFSDDVLNIEICGPQQHYLSVIDVPGIFKNTKEGMTTVADMEIVRNIVNRYMKDPRSINLAVVPANDDIATQEILKMAGKSDIEGERTLGILTKQDLVDKGAETRIIDLVEGRSYKLKLGWSMVKNPGQADLKVPTFDRHASEKKFFESKEPWARLQKDRVGVGSLRAQLRDLLTEMVDKEFTSVKLDINKRLNEYQKQLELLGPSRETSEQQHEYLRNLASRFQSMTLHALAARYGADSLFDSNPDLRLVTAVAKRDRKFADDVWKRGHTMTFSKASEAFERNHEQSDEDDAEDSDKEYHQVRYIWHHRDLDVILDDGCNVPRSKPTGILSWLEDVYNSCHGFELGKSDMSLLPVVWKKQSANWDSLAVGFVSDIVCVVHNFISALILAISTDQDVHSALMSTLMDGLIDRYRKSIDHAKFIISVERDGTLLTMNNYFANNLEKCRRQRLEARLEELSTDIRKHGEVEKLYDILQISTASNTDMVIRDLHDILKSYYKVARKRFVDVVCMQAVDHYLLTGPDAPVHLFSPSFVSGLTDGELGHIAGEDSSTTMKRCELKREIYLLPKVKKILF